MSGIALPPLNTDLQTGICTLQMLIPLQQKQAGDHLSGLSLLCQQSRDTTVMTALRNASENFRLTSGSNKACLSPPWQWRRLLIFIVSRLFIPRRICGIVVCQPGAPQTPLPLPPSKGRGEAGANGSRAPPKSWSLQQSKSQQEGQKSVLAPFKQETLHLIQQEWEQMSRSERG